MALYPGESGEKRFQAEVLKAAVTRIFDACGMTSLDASVVADTLVHADFTAFTHMGSCACRTMWVN